MRLVAVKVLDCEGNGTSAGVAAGVDWVTGHHTGGPAVANMSLGGGAPDPVGEAAVRASIADGVTYAVAAGNEYGDACDSSPANVAEAITVSASDSDDYRALFANYGTCTDIFAPGMDIKSTWHSGDTATNTINGTSGSLPMSASDGASPYTWSATGLPAGLSINSSSGLISGTATTAGVSTVTVTATGADDRSGGTSFTWTVSAQAAAARAPARNW